MEDQGWIKVFRILLDKPIWLQSTPEQKAILITLLLMANHKEKEWEWNGEKFKIMPGQFITSLNNIVKKCGKGISIQNVRTALDRFKKYEFLTYKSTKTGRLINIVNWRVYQRLKEDTNKDNSKELTKSQQSINKELTTNKNDNNVKNEKKNNIYSQIIKYLNVKTSKNYKPATKKTVNLIEARLKEGFLEDDFKKVIDIKCAEWLGSDMEKYLRPETLFGNKFEGYLNQKITTIKGNEQVSSDWRNF